MNAGQYEVVVAGQVTMQPLHLTYTDELAPRADLSLSGLSGSPGDTLWLQVGWEWIFGVCWLGVTWSPTWFQLTEYLYQSRPQFIIS